MKHRLTVTIIAMLIWSLTGSVTSAQALPPGMEGGGVPHECFASDANPHVNSRMFQRMQGGKFVQDTAGITCRDGQLRRIGTLADPYDRVEYIFGRSQLQILTSSGWVTRDETAGDVDRSFGDQFRVTSLKLDTFTECVTTLNAEKYTWRTVTTWTIFVGRVGTPEQIIWESDEVHLGCA